MTEQVHNHTMRLDPCTPVVRREITGSTEGGRISGSVVGEVLRDELLVRIRWTEKDEHGNQTEHYGLEITRDQYGRLTYRSQCFVSS